MNEFKSKGEDVFISDKSYIKHPNNVSIGHHCAIDNGVTVSTSLEVGDYVHIAPNVTFIGGKKSKVILEDFSFVSAGTCIVAGSEDYTGKGLVGPTIPIEYREITFSEIKFEKFAGCGVNCTIMPNVKFGEGAILGANSLALTDLEPWMIYVGSPAKPVKKRDKKIILKNAKKLGYEF
jgi:galactoside O-acetyltransferase